MQMDFTNINFMAIIVIAILHMLLGFLWYGPLFSKPWMALQGWTQERMQQENPNPVIYVVPLIGALLSAYTLALLINATQMGTLVGGAGLGLLIGIGFIASAFASNYLFSGRPFKLFLIDVGYYLVSPVIAGAILGAWR
jgi:hypothetical protein